MGRSPAFAYFHFAFFERVVMEEEQSNARIRWSLLVSPCTTHNDGHLVAAAIVVNSCLALFMYVYSQLQDFHILIRDPI